MTTTTRQTIWEWISNLRQSKQSPADKLAEVEQLQLDKGAELERVLESSEQAVLERELRDLAAERLALVLQMEAQEIATYRADAGEWESDQEGFIQEVATDLLAIEAKLDRWAAHYEARPRPPKGQPEIYSENNHKIYHARIGLANAGQATGKFDVGGTNDAPRLVPHVPSTQVWGVPLGLAKGK